MASEDELRRALPYAEAWGVASRTLAFRRIAGLLIRSRGGTDRQLRIEALATLERLRPQVPVAARREAIQLAAAHWPDRSLLWLFRHEAAGDIVELAASARLTDTEWSILAAELPEPTRQFIAGLRAQALSASATGHPAVEEGARKVDTLAGKLRLEAGSAIDISGDWRWECDSDGRFGFIDGAAPVVVGDRLFDLAGSETIWSFFARRAPFRGVRIEVGEGTCLFGGVPFFERGSGGFLGYRGTAHGLGTNGLFGTGASSESLAKVAHEVRSPLNAIMGFAQMIESETLGSAPEAQRRRAGAILDNAHRLLGALDDLTDAARLDRGHWPIEPAEVDLALFVERIAERHRPLAAARGVSVAVTLAPSLPPAFVDERSLDRAGKRLLAAVVAVAEGGETLLFGAQRAGGELRLFLTRPSALDDLPPERLLDTASVAGEGGGAPLLGLGFGLRLVRQLAEAMGGSFAIEPHRFVLTVPSAAGDQQAVANQDQSA